MHILYIHQYFATPKGITGTRSFEFAKRWAKKGHKVTMLTTTAQLTDDDLKNADGRLLKKVTIGGFSVLVICIPYEQQMGIAKRILSFLAFSVISSVAALFIKKIDVIYATSTPLTVGISAIVLKWLKHVPFVFEVRDMWPAGPVGMGIIKNKVLIKILLWLAKTVYEQSEGIVALSPGMADNVRSALERLKPIVVIPNCSDIDVFQLDIDGSSVRKRHGWGDKFILLHAGAMGRVNSLDFVIDAGIELKDNPDILFVLLGQGARKPALESRVKEHGLTNVEILPSVHKQQLAEVFAASDVALVIIGNFPIAEHNSANKFFDGLSAGKPVLLNYSGWQRDILEKSNAGFGCKLCDINEFVEKVLYLNSNRAILAEMGRNARLLAEDKFDRDKLAQDALDFITAAKGVSGFNRTQ